MPDKWLTAQLNLTALTPFKAFAPITTAFAIAFLSSTAIAETTEERQACFSDAFRVCWSAIPDRNAVFHCLMDNRPRLNPACRTVMDQYRREHKSGAHRATLGPTDHFHIRPLARLDRDV